jgi:UDP-glucose-4-epimerase GalE
MRRAILVTGGAGYIGSHTCKALAAAGYQPVVLDNLSTGHRWAVQWGPLVVGDLSDGALLRHTLKQHTVAGVIHFAAHAYVGESMLHPRKYFANNCTNSLSLVDAMVDVGIGALVFSSSCATYGIPLELPIQEVHPQKPISPYGASKLFIENALCWYETAYQLRSVSLRYFNAAGADLSGELGECHDPETHLIPLVIAAAQGRIPYVDIFGTDYDTPDGTAIRDYIHVADLADAHVKAVGRLLAGQQSETFNLGTGQGHTIGQVITMVEKVGGRPVPMREAGRRPGDPAALVASAERAKQVLDWMPHRSDLATIIESAWHWHRIAGSERSDKEHQWHEARA